VGQFNWYRRAAGVPNVTANATKTSQAQAVVWAYILQRCTTSQLVTWSQQIRLFNVTSPDPLFDLSGGYLSNYPQESTELLSLHNHPTYAHTARALIDTQCDQLSTRN
jgi:hypothetical protein